MADSSQERTEDATPRRRQEARKKGTVTRSIELVHSLVLIGLLASLPMLLPGIASGMRSTVSIGLGHFPTNLQTGDMLNHVAAISLPSLLAFLPLLGVIVFMSVGANMAQVGFLVSTEAIQPKFAKINPLNGVKRLFSMQAGMEGLKAMAKTALFGFLAYQVVAANWPLLLTLSYYTPIEATAIVGDILRTIIVRVAMAWLVLAAVDYFFQRKQIDKQLKMTKEEVKQEMRQNEQSPEIRAAMAQRRRRLLRGRTAQAVRSADVIITNPTHFAVALKYDRDSMHSPQVVAKGADFLAAKIRELAEESKVPIVPNPPLARQLYKRCEVGDFVPRELFQAVAEVLAYVYSTLKKVKA